MKNILLAVFIFAAAGAAYAADCCLSHGTCCLSHKACCALNK
jgi:hypothetical protein